MCRVAMVSVLLGAVSGCASHDEVARVTSPDRSLDAVIIESNGGATTSFWYDVYVVKAGSGIGWASSVMNSYGAIRSEEAYGLNLKWQTRDTLAIEFLRAKTLSDVTDHVRVGGRTVRIVLRQGVTDPFAPPGGMLYNLQGRPYDRS